MGYRYYCSNSLDSSYSIHGDCLLENIYQSRVRRSTGTVDVRTYRKPCDALHTCLSGVADLQGVTRTSTPGGQQFLMFERDNKGKLVDEPVCPCYLSRTYSSLIGRALRTWRLHVTIIASTN
jgi:hypothetical protein